VFRVRGVMATRAATEDEEERVSTDPESVTGEELEAQEGSPLPDREAMSTVRADLAAAIDNFAMPINEAIAINNNSVDSVAIADADQIVILEQVDED
jgi:hypothetical protein